MKNSLNYHASEDNPKPSAHSYWSGFYASRPALKKLAREKSLQLEICKHLETGFDTSLDSTELRKTIGLLQHHDAITGTSRQYVVDDYIDRLHRFSENCTQASSENKTYLYNSLAINRNGVPALGYARKENVKFDKSVKKSETSIGNQNFELAIDTLENLEQLTEFSVVNLKDSTLNFKFSTSFQFYESHPGSYFPPEQASGAYCFRPLNNTANSCNDKKTGKKFEILEELNGSNSINLKLSTFVDQKFIIQDDYIILKYKIGPLPIRRRSKIGKEVIFRIDFTDSILDINSTWQTDSNNYLFIERDRNKFTLDEPVSSRYYPATGETFLVDLEQKFHYGLLFDRAVGTTSLQQNQLEIMLHRRTLTDDRFGLLHNMNDDSSVEGEIVIYKNYANRDKWYAKSFHFPLTEVSIPKNSGQQTHTIAPKCDSQADSCSYLIQNFPENIHVLSFEKIPQIYVTKPNQQVIVIRLENLAHKSVKIQHLSHYFNFLSNYTVEITLLDGFFDFHSVSTQDSEGSNLRAKEIVTFKVTIFT